MTKAAKHVILAAAMIGSMVWILALVVLFGRTKPHLVAVAAAYPLMVMAGLWLAGFLGAVAFACFMEEDGVDLGVLAMCAFIGPPLIAIGGGIAAFLGPMIGAISLGEKWFPADPSKSKPLPPDHWSKRIVFRCPGKAPKTKVPAG